MKREHPSYTALDRFETEQQHKKRKAEGSLGMSSDSVEERRTDEKRFKTVLDVSGDDDDSVPDKVKTKKVRITPPSTLVDIRKELEREEEKPKETRKQQVKLPDPAVHVCPDVFLKQLVVAMFGYEPHVRKAMDVPNFFPEISDAQIAAYDMDVVSACRTQDMVKVKQLYNDGKSLDCCNRFGESVLHMACRRGFVELGTFLLCGAPKLPVRIRDDCGRTPLHDIMWNPTAQLELARMVIERDSTLLFLTDKRGHTPFAYSRGGDWPKWRKFLFEHREFLNVFGTDESKAIFKAGATTSK